MVALVGYFGHDRHEEAPFVLLDSLEAIDVERGASLVEYFDEYTEYLLVALLPKDAGALPNEYQRVTKICNVVTIVLLLYIFSACRNFQPLSGDLELQYCFRRNECCDAQVETGSVSIYGYH